MQNIEKERSPWLKLGAVLLWILLWALPNIFASDTKMNLDDVSKIQMLKVFQAIGVVFLFILPAVLFAQFATSSKMHYLGITKRSTFNTMLIGGLGMVLALPLINGLAQLNQQVHFPEALQGVEQWMKNSEENAKNITDAFLQGSDLSSLLINLFIIAFMAALSEELFFRGVLQNVLIDCFKNKHLGVWIGAIIFSAFHLQFYGFLPRLLMGAYLGYLFVWTGSLWPSIVAHFLNNGLAVYVAWLANKGIVDDDLEKVGEKQQEWIYVLISAGMVIFSLILVHRIERRKLENK
jgi:uncharacterized protein